ncbi:MAG: S9 family peptidase [Chloroflexi bacterium]|nr:S9 family peptidase [Chloroflexota bacterium]
MNREFPPDASGPASGSHHLRPIDTVRFVGASDAQPSPDGTRIAYVATSLDIGEDVVRTRIHLIDPDGLAIGIVGGAGANTLHPRWSPDGTLLAFVTDARDGRQVWVTAGPGSDAVQLTRITGGVSAPPVWSPDGRSLAITARVRVGVDSTPSANRDPATPPEHAPRVVTRLRYLLDGSGYLGDRWSHIFVVPVRTKRAGDFDAGDVHMLNHETITSGAWHHLHPTWSPDGSRIACVTTRRPDWDLEWVWDVLVFDRATPKASPQCLTTSRGVCAAPAWSPDGRWIAYFDNQCSGTGTTKDYHLWRVAVSGSADPEPLSLSCDRGSPVNEPPATNEPPQWSADSGSIHFQIREGSFYVGCRWDEETRRVSRVLEHRGAGGPVSPVVRRNLTGSLTVFTAATGTQPPEVYVIGPSGVVRQITGLNRDALDRVTLGEPHSRTLFASDGTPVESWIWMPPGTGVDHPPLPAILFFHGGPHNTVNLSFNEPMHVLAGAGFAVIAPNFRGSTGYGAAFADVILGDWGTRELEDGLAIVDALVADGTVDPSHVGVFGGSYGGFMTNLAIGRTNRFRAGVSFATISRLDTFALTTDHWESIDWDSAGTPWERPDYYRSHSPLTEVQTMHAPLLILHGEEDFTCPVGEADQLFAALRKLKRTVELVRYPGGSHAFSGIGRPSHRIDAAERMVEWFSKYVS